MQEVERRVLDAKNTEEYVLSVCLHNKQALAKAMNRLQNLRDFKIGNNSKAFGILQNKYQSEQSIDPMVVCDTWIDLGIYSEYEAKAILGRWEGDADYEPKINELARLGGKRKAKKDITKLYDISNSDADPEQLAKQALDMAVSWNGGAAKKYKTAFEVHNQKDERGEFLHLGIPLLDEIYQHSGLHKGTVKSSIFRSKHGKTRSSCWEVAQHLRQGRTVLYFTLEGQNNDILDNVKQILKDEWKNYGDKFLLVDDAYDIDSMQSIIIEAEFTQSVDVVVVDYLQEIQVNVGRWIGDNERITESCRRLTQLCVKYNFLLNLLSQVTTTEKGKKGYGHVPEVHDAYGSKQIVKASSMIMIGFRPKNFDELISQPVMPGSKPCVKDPEGNDAPMSSVFIKPALSRKKLLHQHRWIHFIDTDNGLKLHSQQLI